MQKLIQIIYISRSAFLVTDYTGGIEPNVARILSKSRVNNRNKGLVGVLYFGDGCFFQCLEGEEQVVEALYETLLKDSRHTDLKLLSRKMISQLSFPDWSMKYVGLESEMKRLLAAHGYSKFDPYSFNAEITQSVMGLLHAANDPGESTERVVPSPVKKPHESSNGLAKWAIAISLLALALSCASTLMLMSH